MKKKVIFIFMFLSLIMPIKNSYCQHLSEREKEIYYEIINLEYQLAKRDPNLMDKGDYYYTDRMEGNVLNVISRKYSISIDQAWNIMQRGLARKITPQEKELLEKISAALDPIYDDDSYTQEQIEEFTKKLASKYGTTFNILCELERRMFQQMGGDEEW